MGIEDTLNDKTKWHKEDDIVYKTHAEDSLSGVQSVKSGTKRGTLSMFFK